MRCKAERFLTRCRAAEDFDIVDVDVAVCGVAHVGATGDKLDHADVAAAGGLAHGDGSGERGDTFE